MADRKIQMILADDHQIVRQGLKSMLLDFPEMEIVAEADSGRSAAKLCYEMHPDVIVMDILMPDLNGIEATRQIRAQSPDVKIVALSVNSDRRSVVEMLRAGAHAYVLKDAAFEELYKAILAVVNNKRYLSSALSDLMVEQFLYAREESPSSHSILSPREIEVLQLLSEGGTTKEIAKKLSLSTKTVEAHRYQIMRKLNIHNIAGLTKYALHEGITSAEY